MPCRRAVKVAILDTANGTVGLQLFDKNEEALLYVFGGTLPMCYDIGMYAPRGMDLSRLKMAVLQADKLLQVFLFATLRTSNH